MGALAAVCATSAINSGDLSFVPAVARCPMARLVATGSWAEPGQVLVSSTVRDLVVGSGIEFTERGAHELEGVPGQWRLYAAAV